MRHSCNTFENSPSRRFSLRGRRVRDEGGLGEDDALLDNLLVANLQLEGEFGVVLEGCQCWDIKTGIIYEPGRCRAWYQRQLQQSS